MWWETLENPPVPAYIKPRQETTIRHLKLKVKLYLRNEIKLRILALLLRKVLRAPGQGAWCPTKKD